jgi:hypothetical protein
MDAKRKLKLEAAISAIQEKYSLDWLYCVGLSCMIRDEQYDLFATGEEIKALLIEHGMKVFDISIEVPGC